jgi:hypothetical protein
MKQVVVLPPFHPARQQLFERNLRPASPEVVCEHRATQRTLAQNAYELVPLADHLSRLKRRLHLAMIVPIVAQNHGEPMPKLTLSVDRRADVRDQVLAEVCSLGESINGFDYELFTEERPDGGKFRDFVPIAWLRHAESDALFAVVEELIDIFGWAIDVSDGE